MGVAFLQTNGDGVNRTTYTFAGESLGTAAANRHIIVGVHSRMSGTTATTFTVTVGGVAATVVKQRQNGITNSSFAGLAIAAVPTGTTGDVVVVFTNTQARCGIALWRADGLVSATPTDTDDSVAAAPTATLDIAVGFAIGVATVTADATTSTAWTNATERYDTLVESLMQVTGADATVATAGTRTLTATFTNGGAEPVGAFATWETTVTPTTASLTLTGYAPTVMAGMTVTISGTDYTSYIRDAAFSLTECANRGEVGTGGFDVNDLTSALTIPALKAVLFLEPAATDPRTFTGFTQDRSTAYITDTALTARSWGVECVDLNILASDYVLTAADSADRGVETDYARIVWLLTSVFGSTGSISSGVVPNSNTVTMEATDYRGRKPADVLAECSEAAGKLWFIYDYGSGRKLYYDVATGTSLSSTAKISDVAGDPNGTTVFAPVGNVIVKRSPDRIYSKIHLTYNGGTVTVSNGSTASTYRAREAAILDASINDSTLATAKANTLLTGAAAELVEISDISIVMTPAYLNTVRAGQRIQIKLTRQGIAAYTYYRIIKRTVAPLGVEHYSVSLGLASDVLASANGGRGSDDIWEHKSNANDDGATVIVDRGGITVTDGAITVTNSGATVIIDGESNMFKIAASGTLTTSIAADTNGGTSVALSGLGVLSEPKAILAFLRDGTTAADAASTLQARYVGVSSRVGSFDLFAASASGGSPNVHFAATQTAATAATSLDGSGYEDVEMNAFNASAATRYYYMKYYVLQEAAI